MQVREAGPMELVVRFDEEGHSWQDEANCLVEPEKLPADRFVTNATAADLPNAHYGMSFLGPAASVDLDNTHVPVVSDLKAVAALESLASDGSIASSIPLRASKI